MPDGAVICVHSMLTGFGYLVGGPAVVIEALLEAVPGCTIMMPSFPFGGSCLQYLKSIPVLDVRTTPSRSGLLTETLRLWPGARRSAHPTHPCVAFGPRAAELVDEADKSQTPFGDDSTYGRHSALAEAVLLLLHTNNTSFVHRIQEMTDMPNLFLPDLYAVTVVDVAGKAASRQVKVHRPTLPLYVITEGDQPDAPEYVWFPDYVLPFPAYNRERILSRLRSAAAKRLIIDRHDNFVREGTIRTARVRNAEVAAIRVLPWQARICGDLRQSIARFASLYSRGALERAHEDGLLAH